MISRKGIQEWFYAPDFQQSNMGDLFVGYEASARMSELAKMYPSMIGVKKDGKYRYIRFKFENIDEIFDNFDRELVDFLDTAFMKYGVPKERGKKVEKEEGQKLFSL